MFGAPRTPKTRALIAFVAGVLAGSTVLLDEAVLGAPFGDEIWIDIPLGLTLAITAAIGAFSAFRLSRSQATASEHARRTTALADAAWVISQGGHARDVLDQLAEHACSTMEVERAAIFVRDENDPRLSLVVAGHGVADDFIGQRFGIDEGMAGQVFMSGMPVLVRDYQQFRRGLTHAAVAGAHASGAVPICWGGEVRGVLSVGTTDPDRSFGERELEMLSRLADLGAVALEQAEMRDGLERAMRSGMEALSTALDMRDSYAAQHSEEIVELAVRVGRRLGFDDSQLGDLALAARLHDIGKLAIPDPILHKPGELDPDEWEVMKRHPVWGAEMLARIHGMQAIAAIVRCGHERWDGEGYPDGLRRDEIPLASRVILACDAYHAMVSDRPYRVGLRPWMAVSKLREGAGAQFDPDVIDALVAELREASLSTTRMLAAEAPA
jgi:HD-GYP domain-containing protein (c-di-GMP phosphodiesterase class II)